jgi:hypothetical protein
MGKDRVCRCGCAGEYVKRGEPNFDKRLKRFEKMLSTYELTKDDEIEGEFINVSYGKDRALTVYFD